MKPVEPPDLPNTQRIVFAKDQPEYRPLPAVRDVYGQVTTEWELDDDDRVCLLDGGRIRLTILTFNKALQPVRLSVVPALCPQEAIPESVAPKE